MAVENSGAIVRFGIRIAICKLQLQTAQKNPYKALAARSPLPLPLLPTQLVQFRFDMSKIHWREARYCGDEMKLSEY